MSQCHSLEKQVDPSCTAAVVGSGDMPVLATPTLVAWMEQAALELAATMLEPGQTTVGVHVQTSHVKASKVGAVLRVQAVLVERDGRKMRFDIGAYEHGELVGQGTHDRVVVDRERFLNRL